MFGTGILPRISPFSSKVTDASAVQPSNPSTASSPPASAASRLPPRTLDRHAALTNLGHTCYMNAVLQSLFYSPYRAAVLGKARLASGTAGAGAGVGAGAGDCSNHAAAGGADRDGAESSNMFAPNSVGASLQTLFRYQCESMTLYFEVGSLTDS
jgi:hypothetical protein